MRIAVGLFGFLSGLLAGVILLLFNPLASLRALPPLPADIAPARLYRWDQHRGSEGGVADLLGLGRRDRNVALPDPALAHLGLGIVVLPAGQGAPAALAVKVSVTASGNSLWQAQLATHDYWSIFWPGEGGLFASSYSNLWNLARDEFIAGLSGGDLDARASAYPVSAPPPGEHAVGVTGAAGRYAGFTGEIREFRYPASQGQASQGLDRAIAIKANPPPVTNP